MQSNHLQSLIALNANRITAKHNSIEDAIAQAKQFKLVNIAPAYRQHVEAMVATAFKIADKGRSELKKAVELQKALQAELRANRVAERADKPSRFFTHQYDFSNDAFCVELKSTGERVVHCKDGSSRECNPHWSHNFPGVVEHITRQYPVDVQAPGIYSIDDDGQPKVDGVYEVFYKCHQPDTEIRQYSNGKWTYEDGRWTAFGNSSTDGERYLVK